MAFPTTSVLDDFNRANVGPPPSASWGATNVFLSAPTSLRVLSNELGKLDGGFGGGYWGTSFDADQEVYLTVTTLPASGLIVFLLARLVDPGSPSAVDGYGLAVSTSGWAFYRITNGGQSNVRTISGPPAVAAGDGIGFVVVGDELQAWYRPGAGSWTLVDTHTDTTYPDGGYVGIDINDSVSRFDDFGGGTIVVGPPPDTEAPSAPASLNAAPISARRIALSWSAATDNVGVAHYLVERCSGVDCTSFVQVAVIDGTGYTDSGLEPETLYRYRVRAVDLAENVGDYSPIAEATTLALSTGEPTIIDVLDGIATTLAPLFATIPDLQVVPHLNFNPSPPSIDVYPGDPFSEQVAYSHDNREFLFTVRARVSTADHTAGQELLLRMMDRNGGYSVGAALAEDRSLDGTVDDSVVEGPSGFVPYPDAGGANSGSLLGAEWRLRVLA